jgi:hypothetical protein
MTLLPLTDCCLLLGVDPKTLRHWLQSAHLSCTPHPGDARLKCLPESQLHHLADLHGRPLPNPLPLAAPTACPVPPPCAPLSSSSPAQAESDLRHLLTHLQTQVATLQEQVTQLALLREHERHAQELLSPQGASLPPSATLSEPARPSPATSAPRPVPDAPSALPPRARSRALPLIEYGADGTYLAICPTQGLLSLVPDSAEWFDWLSSLTAFTFHGAKGHFSTTRKMRQGQRVQAWSAYRSLRGRSCTLYLGLTSHLTLAHLEEMATTIHERLTSV